MLPLFLTEAILHIYRVYLFISLWYQCTYTDCFHIYTDVCAVTYLIQIRQSLATAMIITTETVVSYRCSVFTDSFCVFYRCCWCTQMAGKENWCVGRPLCADDHTEELCTGLCIRPQPGGTGPESNFQTTHQVTAYTQKGYFHEEKHRPHGKQLLL